MTEHNILNMLPDDGLHGRRKIYCDSQEINADNVVDVVGKAMATHSINRREENYLYDYYCGKQDIRGKEKVVRPEINNKVTVNRAYEIVTFDVSYLFGEPLLYASRGGSDKVSKDINTLNDYMYEQKKAAKDKSVANWAHICGVGVRMVLPNTNYKTGESPARIYTLDPREAFVIYSSDIGNDPMAGVIRRKDKNGRWFSCVYTDKQYFEIKGDKVTVNKHHILGFVPVIEYVVNESRIGAFEVVLPLLNAINVLESNRVDSVQDFVNAYDVFQNCEIDEATYKNLAQGGQAIMIKNSTPGMDSKVYRIFSELNQVSTQTAVDDLYDAVLTICGMPNRNGGSSTSDTGAATIMRDGWYNAEAGAKDTEVLWEQSDDLFLDAFLRICQDIAPLDLKRTDIRLKFTRRNYADIQSKAQVLAEMLNNDKIHPKLAFQVCGLFTDAEEAYRISNEYYEEQSQKVEEQLKEELDAARAVHNGGQDNNPLEQESNPTVSES